VIRGRVAPAVVLVALLLAPSGGAALKAGSAGLTVTQAGANQFVFQIQNTGTSVIGSFVLVLGAGFTATSVVSTTGGTCQLAGGTVTCTGLALAGGCDCAPGQSAFVTINGSGDPAGTTVGQIVEVLAPAGAGTQHVSPVPTVAPTPKAPTSSTVTKTTPIVSVTPLMPVLLRGSHPALTVTAKLSRPTGLALTLLDANGHTLARWSEQAKTGTVKLELPLPAKARHPGRGTLRITFTGGNAMQVKKMPVLLRL
jgi:hypothetical protein